MEIPWTVEELCRACHETIAANSLGNAYIRPIVWFGSGSLALNPVGKCPVEVAIGAIEWGTYLGEEGLRNGIDVCISSWRRPTSGSIPVLAKAGGNYLNAQLVASEANRNGFLEGIAIGDGGMLAEGSGENLFLVRDGRLLTPPLASSILGGITRDTVFRIAARLEIDVIQEAIPREMLYLADEAFLTGTAAEIVPVRSVDRIPVGDGKAGPVTRSIQKVFFGLFDGSQPDEWGWLDYAANESNAPRRSRSRV
jgi:branched-chain amino acid aminotransferase